MGIAEKIKILVNNEEEHIFFGRYQAHTVDFDEKILLDIHLQKYLIGTLEIRVEGEKGTITRGIQYRSTFIKERTPNGRKEDLIATMCMIEKLLRTKGLEKIEFDFTSVYQENALSQMGYDFLGAEMSKNLSKPIEAPEIYLEKILQ